MRVEEEPGTKCRSLFTSQNEKEDLFFRDFIHFSNFSLGFFVFFFFIPSPYFSSIHSDLTIICFCTINAM